MTDSQDKHDAVATFTREHLHAHLSDRTIVVQDVHPVTIDGGDAAEQKRVMGSQLYAEVLYAGDRRFRPLSVAGTPIETAEVFEINVWLEADRERFRRRAGALPCRDKGTDRNRDRLLSWGIASHGVGRCVLGRHSD